MRLMLIGTDRMIFKEGSAVRNRISRFGENHMGSLTSIVFSTKRHNITEPSKLNEKVKVIPTNSLSRFLYIFDAYRIAKTIGRPDIISAQDPFETGLAAYFIARHFKVPFAVEVHTDFLSPTFRANSLLNRIRIMIANFVIPRAAGGYAVSRGDLDKMLSKYPKVGHFEVLPIFVDIKRFNSVVHRPHPRFKTTLLWVGRLEKEKNPELALQAFMETRKENADLGLVFVGGGSLMEKLKTQASEAGIENFVEFVGPVSDLAPYYAEADLLLVTSKYEGYGMVIVEALSAGVPVLSTDVGVAREAGAIIAERDFSEALCHWLEGSRERGVLKMKAYENEGEYFSKLAKLYSSLCGF